MDAVRSFLAGLRQLVVPWGARNAPRIVIGGEDPLAQFFSQDAAIVFYVSADQAFLLSSDTFANFGQFFLSYIHPGAPIIGILDVTVDLNTDTPTRVDVVSGTSALTTFGGDSAHVQLGDGPSGATARLDLGADQIRLGQFGYPEVLLAVRQLGFEVEIVNQTPPPATTYALGAFANIAGATTTVFNKRYDDTRVELYMSIGMFATAGGTVGQYGLNISGGFGDQLIGQVLLSSPSVENCASAVVRVPGASGGGLPAGAYTLTPRWRRTVGGGTLTLTASSGTLSYSAREIIAP